jgi:hypothetical protein
MVFSGVSESNQADMTASISAPKAATMDCRSFCQVNQEPKAPPAIAPPAPMNPKIAV